MSLDFLLVTVNPYKTSKKNLWLIIKLLLAKLKRCQKILNHLYMNFEYRGTIRKYVSMEP